MVTFTFGPDVAFVASHSPNGKSPPLVGIDANRIALVGHIDLGLW